MVTAVHKLQGAGGFGVADSYWIALASIGSNSVQCKAVAIDSAGDIVVCGFTAYLSGGFVAKYDKDGTLLWSRSIYSGANTEFIQRIATDSSNNIIVVGSSGSNLVVVKYNSSGTLQWQKTVSTNGLWGVATDSSDNILLMGPAAGVSGSSDQAVIKLNSSGTGLWGKILGGVATEQGIGGIAVDSSDNVIVVGATDSDGAGSNDCLIAKYNSSGTLLWDVTLGTSGQDYARAVTTDSSGNIYICGPSVVGGGSYDLLTAKYNSSGTLQWARTLGGSAQEATLVPLGVAVDSSGNVFSICNSASDGSGGDDILIAKYNSSGTLQWDKNLGGTTADYGHGVVIDARGNVIICGSTYSAGLGIPDALIAKLPSDGSGNGTYGNMVYQDAVLTDAAFTGTSAAAVLTDGTTSSTTSNASLSDAALSFTETFYPITI